MRRKYQCLDLAFNLGWPLYTGHGKSGMKVRKDSDEHGDGLGTRFGGGWGDGARKLFRTETPRESKGEVTKDVGTERST